MDQRAHEPFLQAPLQREPKFPIQAKGFGVDFIRGYGIWGLKDCSTVKSFKYTLEGSAPQAVFTLCRSFTFALDEATLGVPIRTLRTSADDPAQAISRRRS